MSEPSRPDDPWEWLLSLFPDRDVLKILDSTNLQRPTTKDLLKQISAKRVPSWMVNGAPPTENQKLPDVATSASAAHLTRWLEEMAGLSESIAEHMKAFAETDAFATGPSVYQAERSAALIQTATDILKDGWIPPVELAEDSLVTAADSAHEVARIARTLPTT